MIKMEMSWNEIKRRAKDGCPLTVLAELNGVDCITMRKAIAQLENETGEKIVWGSLKKPVTKKRKKIDKDQVKAWLIAGKSVNEIARDLGCSTPPIFKIKKELRGEMPDKFKITKKEVTPDGILIEAVPEENKYPFVEIVPNKKEICPEVADQLDQFLEEKIKAIDEEIKMHAKVVEELINLMDSWYEIKKRVEGTKCLKV